MQETNTNTNEVHVGIHEQSFPSIGGTLKIISLSFLSIHSDFREQNSTYSLLITKEI